MSRGGARPRGTSPRGPLPPMVSFFKELCRVAHFIPQELKSEEAIKYCHENICPWIDPYLDDHISKMGPSKKWGKNLPGPGRTLAWYGDVIFETMADVKDLCATTDKSPRYRLGGENMKEGSTKGNMSDARYAKWHFCAEKLRRGTFVSEEEVRKHWEFLDQLKAAKKGGNGGGRKSFPADVRQKIWAFTIEELNGICPCCRVAKIAVKDSDGNWDVIREGGKPDGKALAEYDHWQENHTNSIDNGWRICKPCHDSMNYKNGKKKREENQIHFVRFQASLETWIRSEERNGRNDFSKVKNNA